MAFIIMEMHQLFFSFLFSFILPLSVDHPQNLPLIGAFMGLGSHNNLPFSISGPMSLQMLYAGLAKRTQAIYRHKLQKSLHRLISAPSRSYKSNYSIRNDYTVVVFFNQPPILSLFLHPPVHPLILYLSSSIYSHLTHFDAPFITQQNVPQGMNCLPRVQPKMLRSF